MKKALWFGGVLLLVALSVRAQEVPEEARRHMVRGATAVNMAKSGDELHYAVKEFQEAVRIAPGWGIAWFNLGTVQEKAGDIPGAIVSFRRYVELAPGAEDAPKVRDKLIALEYMQERAQQLAGLAGMWGGHRISVEGNRFVAEGGTNHYSLLDVYFSGDTPQSAKYQNPLRDRFEGTIQGDTIKGTMTRNPFLEERSECVIPEDRSEFTAKVSPDGNKIKFQYGRAHYRVDWSGIFWGLSSCTSVVRDKSEPVDIEWERSEPQENGVKQPVDLVVPKRGIVGLRISTTSLPPRVEAAIAGKPAERAGIKEGDRLVAIDGVDVRNATTEQVVEKLRGNAGTSVKVTVVRGDSQPVEYTLEREAFEMLE